MRLGLQREPAPHRWWAGIKKEAVGNLHPDKGTQVPRPAEAREWS